MQRLVKIFIIVMSIIYLALLAAPAWSVDAPTDGAVICAFSRHHQRLVPHDDILRLGPQRGVPPV
jgi:hypothetical protein